MRKETEHGIVMYSNQAQLDSFEEVFKKYLTKEVQFIDLGSADGAVVKLAAKYTPASYGIEIDKDEAVNAMYTTFNMNFLDLSFRFLQSTVLFYHILSSYEQDRLIQKLHSEFKGILIIADFINPENLEIFAENLGFEVVEKFTNVWVLNNKNI